TGADLTRTNLRAAHLDAARLAGCELVETHLGNASLRNADLTGAHLAGTVLLGSDLREADMADAEVADFQWNRLTRFSGIRGFEAEEQGDEEATQRYVAPVALGAHDIDTGAQMARASDPELERPRLYRSDVLERPVSDPAAALEPIPRIPTTRQPTPPASLSALRHMRRQTRRMAIFCAAALILAMAATADVIRLRLDDRPAPTAPPTARLPEPPTSSPLTSDDRAAYRARIRSLTDTADRLEQQVAQAHDQTERAGERLATAAGRIEALERARRDLAVDNASLREASDRVLLLEATLAEARNELAEQIDRNRRLEQASTILARGVDTLRTEKRKLEKHVYGDQLANEHRIRDLSAKVTTYEQELATVERKLDATAQRNMELEHALATAEESLTAFTRRIQGTHLESLLGEAAEEQPLLQITPGRVIALGGDYLITLRVDHEPGEGEEQHLRSELVVQGPPGERLPEVGVAFYGPDGRPLRKVAYAFPASAEARGFASAVSILSSPVFPRSARVILTPAGSMGPRLGLGDRQTTRPE
ncbi:MAG: pentapeptide repeat-containing protein, partial [Planctomycetota bacterium]